MSCLHYKNNELWIENVSLKNIAMQFGTPCYVYSYQAITNNWLSFAHSLTLPHYICYAVKANSNLAILNILAKRGAGFDIVSGGELTRVLTAGGNPNKIVFSGVGKSSDELEQAINANLLCINVESVAELERIQSIASTLNKIAHVALRINPDVDAKTHAHISTGLKQNKFGIDADQAIDIIKKINTMSAIQLVGIGCHIGSQILSLNPFANAFDRIIQLYQQISSLGIQLKYINVGGGLGIQYHHNTPPSIKEYTQLIQNKFSTLPVKVIIEPGRSIIGNAGCLLTKVEYIKQQPDINFAIIDAGMNDFVRPTLYDAWQPILAVNQRTQHNAIYDVVGPVCESADVLGKERELAISAGDLLAIDYAGAYGFSMSSNYNSRGRAAEVLVHDQHTTLIRRRESHADLFALENIPSIVSVDDTQA